MTEFKKAEITVRSVIDEISSDGFPTGEPEINIITAEGDIEYGEGTTTLKYLEKSEGGEVVCQLTLINSGRISLVRKGAVECRLDFEEGKTVKTLYSVPPYSFDMTVTAKKVSFEAGADGGDIRLVYFMNIGGRDAKVNMKIAFRIK